MGPPKISSKKADQEAFSCIPGGFFMRSHNKLGPYEKSFMADQGAFSCIPGGFYMRSYNRLGPYVKSFMADQGALCIPGGLIHSSSSGYQICGLLNKI